MSIKTQNELKQEWGLERSEKAYRVLVHWLLKLEHGHPYSEEELANLANLDRDAFDLFATWTRHEQEDETPYTYRQAKADIGESTDWEDARSVSLKKWRQIAAGDEDSYRESKLCGYCFVAENRAGLDIYSEPCPQDIGTADCPARRLCTMILGSTGWEAVQVVQDIEELEHPRKEKI